MFFKNLSLFRITGAWPYNAVELAELLSEHRFTPCTSLVRETSGWVPPREGGELVHVVNNQQLIVLAAEKKLLPGSVIKQVTAAKAVDLEEKQGFKPGRKQMKELKEEVIDELLPKAFAIQSRIAVWIDPIHGWIGIDSGSTARVDLVFKQLLKALEKLPVERLTVSQEPASAMTEWLASDEAPAGFTIDQDTELRATSEGKATVRYVRHSLEVADVRQHIAGGKRCTRLALTWSDRISFVLNDALTLKRIAPLDVLKENTDLKDADAETIFDTEFALMSGEFHTMLSDLTAAMRGIRSAENGLVQ